MDGALENTEDITLPEALPTSAPGWPRVLVIEDDESHRLALEVGLKREGFSVDAVSDGRAAVAAVERLRPDVICLDLMLPGLSGLDICRELRARGCKTPVVVISAKEEELDIVLAIEVGADDYLSKPYSMRELVARIRAQLRREVERVIRIPGARAAIDALSGGDVVLDPDRHEVYVRGARVELPLREFQVLQALLEQRGRVIRREDLLDEVWGLDYDGDPRIVATVVGRLRSRIEEDPTNPRAIATIRGVGYRFNDR
ncbi:MAG TPA: response regulator transcription factor [Acidimicrobiales bacterium]|nr:response regulator transcription factor [Acidimicrobiales bacterium]